MSAPPAVSYFNAMFANDPLGEHSFSAAMYELEATCYHEAAHAVAGYVLGNSLASIGVCATKVSDEQRRRTVGYGGEVRIKTRSGNKRMRLRSDYGWRHFSLGCSGASGPAGERRFRYEAGLPMILLGASEGDHTLISGVARILEGSGRCRYAFERLAWHSAQRLMARDDVWAAVEEVASRLFDSACVVDLETDGDEWAFLEPRAVYAACRRHGLHKGMARPAKRSANSNGLTAALTA